MYFTGKWRKSCKKALIGPTFLWTEAGLAVLLLKLKNNSPLTSLFMKRENRVGFVSYTDSLPIISNFR